MLYHLSSSALTHGIYLPTPSDFNKPRRATRAPYRDRNIRGISTHKVYPLRLLLAKSVRSYRTFSPLPIRAVIFCDTCCITKNEFSATPSVRWCGALRCPDFPHLPNRSRDRAVRINYPTKVKTLLVPSQLNFKVPNERLGCPTYSDYVPCRAELRALPPAIALL